MNRLAKHVIANAFDHRIFQRAYISDFRTSGLFGTRADQPNVRNRDGALRRHAAAERYVQLFCRPFSVRCNDSEGQNDACNFDDR